MQLHLTRFPQDFLHRFWPRVQKTATCWLWLGTCANKGYGQIRFQNRMTLTHRIAWELHYGPIPAGLFVCHHCDNPPCCNPAHLFLGTNHDNLMDSSRKGRHKNPSFLGSSNPYSKLKESDIVTIRLLQQNGLPQRSLAKQYNVSEALISRIIHRTIWSHV